MGFCNGNYGEQIRIMPGDPKRPLLMKQGPYIEISIQGGKTYEPLFGNPLLQ